MNNKSGMVAFLLSFIPGLGHLYLNRKIRAFLYAAPFFAAVGFFFLLVITNNAHDELLIFLFIIGVAAWGINMLDMIVHLISRGSQAPVHPMSPDGADVNQNILVGEQSAHAGIKNEEKTAAILLAFIPGVGHFQLGLMQRGLTFLVAFFGLFVMIGFVTFITAIEGFLVFLLALPIIVLYSVFDVSQLVDRRARGEVLKDKSIFEELEESREQGRKSKVLATLLSVIPGAGHLYLGLQKRGLQLMIFFFLSLYVLDMMRMTFFLFLIPIIWFYSFFDTLQLISRYGREETKDVPVVEGLMNYHKWIGIGLIALGIYYLLDQVGVGLLHRYFPEMYYHEVRMWLDHYLPTFLFAFVLILVGIKLLTGSKRNKGGESS